MGRRRRHQTRLAGATRATRRQARRDVRATLRAARRVVYVERAIVSSSTGQSPLALRGLQRDIRDNGRSDPGLGIVAFVIVIWRL